MRLGDVYKMVSRRWVEESGDSAFANREVYEAIINPPSKKSKQFLKEHLSAEGYLFATNIIQKMHKKKGA